MNYLLDYAGITIDQLVHVHIYTDGSHLKPDEDDCQQTAWSFNVLGELADGQCVMLGFVSDDVMIDENEQTNWEQQRLRPWQQKAQRFAGHYYGGSKAASKHMQGSQCTQTVCQLDFICLEKQDGVTTLSWLAF